MREVDLLVAGGAVLPMDEANTLLDDGAVAIEGERIAWVGSSSQLPPSYRHAPTIDASERVVLPGFVDSHTHLVFAGNRADEFELRLQGVPYQTIASQSGGINATVRAVRQASKATLKDLAKQRLDRMVAMGVTTVEIKSGYGLSLVDEHPVHARESGARQTVPAGGEGRGSHELEGPPRRRRHARESLQRDARSRRRRVDRVHERLREATRVST